MPAPGDENVDTTGLLWGTVSMYLAGTRHETVWTEVPHAPPRELDGDPLDGGGGADQTAETRCRHFTSHLTGISASFQL